MEKPSDDLVMCWPMYVTDNDVITCHEPNCPEDGHFISFGRRKTFGEIKQDLIDHIETCHRSTYKEE